jgi:hypothetical protein
MFPLGDEIIVGGGTGFAVRLTPNQAETVATNLICEE